MRKFIARYRHFRDGEVVRAEGWVAEDATIQEMATAIEDLQAGDIILAPGDWWLRFDGENRWTHLQAGDEKTVGLYGKAVRQAALEASEAGY